MRIRLEDARFEPVVWRESSTLSPEALGLLEGAELTPVEIAGRLEYAEPDWLLQLGLEYRQTAACDRCLRRFEQAVATVADLIVVGRSGEAKHGETELGSDELAEVEVVGGFLDTGALVAEQVVLAWPAHPLCREDCGGLCPRCGKDRNEGGCSCTVESLDPRWGALAALRDRWGSS